MGDGEVGESDLREGETMSKIATGLAVLGFAAALGMAPAAQAAPINCPGGQTATKTASGWDCVNKGGNTSNAEDPKNPNADKNKF
jgi:hypothetical protein